MHSHRQKILKKLIHSPSLSFNQLWDRDGESNSFAYHLKVLEEDNLVEKIGNHYQLSHNGRKFTAYLDGESGGKHAFPLVGVVMIIMHNDKFLMLKRTKEPFYGYWGFVGGKLKFSQYIMEAAKEELKEETGLECDLEFKGLFSSKTYNNNSLSYNHQLFVIKAINPKGTLIESTREGINKWFSYEEIKDLKTFPNILHSIEIARSKTFRWIEADRFQKNDKFVDIKILNNKLL